MANEAIFSSIEKLESSLNNKYESTIHIVSETTDIRQKLETPIKLDPSKNYKVAMIKYFACYNLIDNITSENNASHYKLNDASDWSTLQFVPSAYEIKDINEVIQEVVSDKRIKFVAHAPTGHIKLKLKPDVKAKTQQLLRDRLLSKTQRLLSVRLLTENIYFKVYINFSLLKRNMYQLYNGGDIQRFSDKLPGLPWAKYPGEKHLFNHSFTGPRTQLDLRLNSDVTPITKPINRVDATAYKHDLVYRDHADLESRHAADLQMIQELQSIPNPTFREKVECAIVLRLLWAKMKLGMGYKTVGG